TISASAGTTANSTLLMAGRLAAPRLLVSGANSRLLIASGGIEIAFDLPQRFSEQLATLSVDALERRFAQAIGNLAQLRHRGAGLVGQEQPHCATILDTG